MVLRSPEGWGDGDPRREARPGSSDGSSAGWHLAMPGARLGPFRTQARGDGSQDYPSYSWGTEVCPWKWQHEDSPIDPEITTYFLTRILKTFCATCKLRTWLEPGEFPRAPVTPSVLALLGRLFCPTPRWRHPSWHLLLLYLEFGDCPGTVGRVGWEAGPSQLT